MIELTGRGWGLEGHVRDRATRRPAAPPAAPKPWQREGLFPSYWAVLGVALLGLAAWSVIFLVIPSESTTDRAIGINGPGRRRQ